MRSVVSRTVVVSLLTVLQRVEQDALVVGKSGVAHVRACRIAHCGRIGLLFMTKRHSAASVVEDSAVASCAVGVWSCWSAVEVLGMHYHGAFSVLCSVFK
jgi:hypothetical protein